MRFAGPAMQGRSRVARRPLVLGLALLAAAAACAKSGERAAKAPALPDYLADVPRLYGSILLDTVGAPGAENRRLVIQAPMDSVAAVYRSALPPRGWQLVGGTSDTAQVTLYLERRGVTLWVLIRKLGPRTTQYSLTAAAEGQPTSDSSRAATPRTPGR